MKKLTYIHDSFLRNSVSMQSNIVIFYAYQSSNLTDEKINQIYCYVRYCSIYKKTLFFYNSIAGNRFGVSIAEFQRLIKITNLLNNFNFERYNYIFGLIYE